MILSRYARWLTLAGWAGLVAGLLAWQALWRQPPQLLLGALLAAPLLLPLPGLWRGRTYTYTWNSLLVLMYLAGLLTAYVASAGRSACTPALLSAGALFVGCVLYVRLRARETPPGA